MDAGFVKDAARACGFELAGIAPALPSADVPRYRAWTEIGMAGAMSYLTGRRARIRTDPRHLLPSARSILCVAKLYNTDHPYSADCDDPASAWISRYAWGRDYHTVLRDGLERLAAMLSERETFEWKICVDTAPLLERSYARAAGLGWIGKNTCLINEPLGSWFFLGELLTSLEIAPDTPPPDRCGTCTRCIDACPTQALVPASAEFPNEYTLDARRCISYFTIELKGPIPEEHHAGIGRHVFGCDICQDVCPWNRKAPVTGDPAFEAMHFAPPLETLASLSQEEFHRQFAESPLLRPGYHGFQRNVALAMENREAAVRDQS